MHEIFLKRAIDLAHKGKYLTKPNPMVGCVIVKDNQVIAEGHHMKYGSKHAEINALEDLNNNNNISEAVGFVFEVTAIELVEFTLVEKTRFILSPAYT